MFLVAVEWHLRPSADVAVLSIVLESTSSSDAVGVVAGRRSVALLPESQTWVSKARRGAHGSLEYCEAGSIVIEADAGPLAWPG